MQLFALDCYPDKDGDPAVVMIVAAETEAAAVREAFDHPNAANYQAIAPNPKQKIRKAGPVNAGIHGFVAWQAFMRLIGKQ